MRLYNMPQLIMENCIFFVYLVFNLKTKTIFIDWWSRDNHVCVQVCIRLISS